MKFHRVISDVDTQKGIEEYKKDLTSRKEKAIQKYKKDIEMIPHYVDRIKKKAAELNQEAGFGDNTLRNEPDFGQILSAWKSDSHYDNSHLFKLIAHLHENYDDINSIKDLPMIVPDKRDEEVFLPRSLSILANMDDKELSNIFTEKYKTELHLKTEYPELIRYDENDKPHMVLNRSMTMPHQFLGRDLPLASYSLGDNFIGGIDDFSHTYKVPVDNVWYSFLHGTNHGLDHENEIVVSPPKDRKQHEILSVDSLKVPLQMALKQHEGDPRVSEALQSRTGIPELQSVFGKIHKDHADITKDEFKKVLNAVSESSDDIAKLPVEEEHWFNPKTHLDTSFSAVDSQCISDMINFSKLRPRERFRNATRTITPQKMPKYHSPSDQVRMACHIAHSGHEQDDAKYKMETAKDLSGGESNFESVKKETGDFVTNLKTIKKSSSGLKKIGSANHLGGMHDKNLYEDLSGKQFLHKPVSDGREWLAHGEVGVGKIGKMINPDKPEISVEKLDGKTGILQEMKDADPISKRSFKFDKKEDIKALQKEHVLDWLTSQHDAHAGQFIKNKANDNLIGIDKGQAFKHFGQDILDIDYHPNAMYGEQEPVYNTMGKLALKGHIKLDPSVTFDEIKKIQAIPDEDMLQHIEPYIQGRFKSESDREDFRQRFKDRKANLHDDFANWYSQVDHNFDASKYLGVAKDEPKVDEHILHGFNEFQKDITSRIDKAHKVYEDEIKAIPTKSRHLRDLAGMLIQNTPSTKRTLIKHLPDYEEDRLPFGISGILSEQKMDSHYLYPFFAKMAIHLGDHPEKYNTIDDIVNDPYIHEMASLTSQKSKFARDHDTKPSDLIHDAIHLLANNKGSSVFEQMLKKKADIKHELLTKHQDLVHYDENDNPHITLGRNTGRPSNVHSKELPLASYGIKNSSLFGRNTSTYHVPVDNVWASYLHEPESNHEYEMLVSPPKDKVSHKLVYQSEASDTPYVRLLKNLPNAPRDLHTEVKQTFGKDFYDKVMNHKWDQKMTPEEWQSNFNDILSEVNNKGFEFGDPSNGYSHFIHNPIEANHADIYSELPSMLHGGSKQAFNLHDLLGRPTGIRSLSPSQKVRYIAHLLHNKDGVDDDQKDTIINQIGEDGYNFLSNNIKPKNTKKDTFTSDFKDNSDSQYKIQKFMSDPYNIAKVKSLSSGQVKDIVDHIIENNHQSISAFDYLPLNKLSSSDIMPRSSSINDAFLHYARSISKHPDTTIEDLGKVIANKKSHKLISRLFGMGVDNKTHADLLHSVINNSDDNVLDDNVYIKDHTSGSQYRMANGDYSLKYVKWIAKRLEDPRAFLRFSADYNNNLKGLSKEELAHIHPNLPIYFPIDIGDIKKSIISNPPLEKILKEVLSDWNSESSLKFRQTLHSISGCLPKHTVHPEQHSHILKDLIELKQKTFAYFNAHPNAITIDGEKCIPLFRVSYSPLNLSTSVERYYDNVLDSDLYTEAQYVPISNVALWFGNLPSSVGDNYPFFIVSPFGFNRSSSSDVKKIPIQNSF